MGLKVKNQRVHFYYTHRGGARAKRGRFDQPVDALHVNSAQPGCFSCELATIQFNEDFVCHGIRLGDLGLELCGGLWSIWVTDAALAATASIPAQFMGCRRLRLLFPLLQCHPRTVNPSAVYSSQPAMWVCLFSVDTQNGWLSCGFVLKPRQKGTLNKWHTHVPSVCYSAARIAARDRSVPLRTS